MSTYSPARRSPPWLKSPRSQAMSPNSSGTFMPWGLPFIGAGMAAIRCHGERRRRTGAPERSRPRRHPLPRASYARSLRSLGLAIPRARDEAAPASVSSTDEGLPRTARYQP